MKIRKLATIVSVAALFGAASPAFAEEATSLSGPDDATGLQTLGIDISRAGSGNQVHQFLAQLPEDTRRGVLGGCQTAVTYPAGYSPPVVAFCNTAVGGSGFALGYAAEPNPVRFPSPMQSPTDVIPPPTEPGQY